MKPRTNILKALCVWLVIGVIFDSSAQSIIRLFSTPAERAELERQRLRASRPDLIEEVPDLPLQIIELPISLEDEEVVEIVYHLGGTMTLQDGRHTVWINDVAIYEDDLPDNIELLEPYSQGRLRISNEESGQSYTVKPGQVLNLTTGELVESYEYVPPAPVIEAAEEAENAVAQMTDVIDAIGSEGREEPVPAEIDIDNAASSSASDVSFNSTQLIDQARELQDQNP